MSNHVCIINTTVGFQNQWSKDGEELEDTRYIIIENSELHILSSSKKISFCIKQNYLICHYLPEKKQIKVVSNKEDYPISKFPSRKVTEYSQHRVFAFQVLALSAYYCMEMIRARDFPLGL